MTQPDDTLRDDNLRDDTMLRRDDDLVNERVGDAGSPMGDGSDDEQKAVGGGAGALGGAAVGTAVGGPVGTVAGAVIGGGRRRSG